jgi:hypothetical protein
MREREKTDKGCLPWLPWLPCSALRGRGELELCAQGLFQQRWFRLMMME